MKRLLFNSWWMFAVRGTAALFFGILALAWPRLTLLFFVVLFSAYALAVGSVAVVAALRTRREHGWWLVLALGLMSLGVGVISLLDLRMTALFLVLVMGAGALIAGVIDLSMAVRLRKEIRNEWLLGLAGLISIMFGAFVVISPGSGALALVWLIALQAIGTGILFIVFGLRMRSAVPKLERSAHPNTIG
jgi:uncharacterized membrane protein HdeD (DUF308 family)